MKRFWFFDLDGTLADTDGDIRLAWKAALADLGLDCPTFDRDFIAGPPIDDMVRKLFPARCADPRAAAELIGSVRTLFGRHYDHDGFPTTAEYPGILDAVRRLKAAGARVFIATNKRYAGAAAMARKFGWDQVFEKLYTGDMFLATRGVKMRKPELLRFILDELGAAPADCVMVGDTINDFEAARQNGIDAIAVAWGYGTAAERRAATRTVTDAAALTSL